jgi:hypothetical protein
MRYNDLRRIRNLEFDCPGADCNAIHNWPRCTYTNNNSSSVPFPLLVCPECKLFIEINPRTNYDFFVGCITESVALELKVFRDYIEWVPELVRATLEESLQCHRVAAWHGCIALARKVVEIMATDLGGQGKSLFKQLEDIKIKGLIAKEFWILEDSVRNLGNLAVHYDPNNPKKCRDIEADCALAYAYEVSKQIYLRRRLERFKKDFHKHRYMEFLDDIKWSEKYGIHPI